MNSNSAPAAKRDTVTNYVEEQNKRPDFQIHRSFNKKAFVHNVTTTDMEPSQPKDTPKQAPVKSHDEDFPGKATVKLDTESIPKQSSLKPGLEDAPKLFSSKCRPEYSPKPGTLKPQPEIFKKVFTGKPKEKNSPEQFISILGVHIPEASENTEDTDCCQTNNDNKIDNSLQTDLDTGLPKRDTEPATPTKYTTIVPSEESTTQSSSIQRVKDFTVIEIEMLEEHFQCERGWMRKTVENYVMGPTHHVELANDDAFLRGTGYLARILEPVNRFFVSISDPDPDGIPYIEEIDDHIVQSDTERFDD